jgi:DNA-binding MarR family transcriptional regulator
MSVSRRLNAEVRNDPGAIQLSSLERMVMRFIDQNPGTAPSRLGHRLGLCSSNTSTALRSLESRGLVERVADPEDGRGVRLYPTQRASDNLVRVRARWAKLLAPLVPADIELRSTLTTLTALDEALNPR